MKEKYTGKIAAAIIEKSNKILIAQRALRDNYGGLWEFPGGKQEYGESIEECLKRELYEEFGIKASVGSYVCSSFFQLHNRPFEILAFKVNSYQGIFQCNVHETIHWINVSELANYTFVKPDYVIIDAIHSGKNT